MRQRTVYLRGLRHYWRAHIATALGVVAGTAALTGALLTGDSMRGSLRDTGLNRLGGIDYAVAGPRYFRAELADELSDGEQHVYPVILSRGGVTHAESRAFADRVLIYGVDESFPSLTSADGSPLPAAGDRRAVVLNEVLARELGAAPGDDVLLRLGKTGDVATETILGDKEDAAATLRLRVAATAAAEGLGAFSINPQQSAPRCAFVPLKTLQRALEREGRANTLLIDSPRTLTETRAALRAAMALEDLGLKLREDDRGYVALESNAFLIAPGLEQCAREAAEPADLDAASVLAYLANRIEVSGRSDRYTPYSTVASIDASIDLPGAAVPGPGQIVLNDWTADDLQARVGDRVTMTYYISGPYGALHTMQGTFELSGIAPLAGAADDAGFTPAFPGVTDAERLSDWSPPFPVNLREIREKDEEYWERRHATPKAFVSLADGQRLWTADSAQYGRITSLRLRSRTGASVAEIRAAFEAAFMQRFEPGLAGVAVDPVRERFIAASKGSTDFGGLFVGFSFFLIISAALLTAMMFRLGVERRASEIGLLLALGFTPGKVARLLTAEGLALAAVASVAGLLVARGYAWLMVAGLRGWWSDAVNMETLRLYDSTASYAIGYITGLITAGASIAWSLRGLLLASPRALLSGVVQSGRAAERGGGRRAGVIAVGAVLAAAAMIVASTFSDAVGQSLAFFLGGTALLAACIAGMAAWLGREPHGANVAAGNGAMLRLGLRNARRRIGRSLLTIGLVASATFIITALQAMRLDAGRAAGVRESGTGGFALRAEAAVGLPYDLNTPDGREALNVSAEGEAVLSEATYTPFRLREGDDVSCLNLYAPAEPRIIGASEAMIERGGFLFTATLAETEEERRNPWTLLRREFADGAVPVIADEGAALWQLHVKLGGDLHVKDEQGRDVALRIVGMIKWSILQSEIVAAESRFQQMFPSISGHAFFLIDAPRQRAREIERTLEREMSPFGLAAVDAEQRLAEMFAVQNTYLSTFQAVGGLGLLLGTIGLAAVMLRNVWERRGELALMQALGFSRGALMRLVMSENLLLVGAGMLSGLASAGLVLAPHLLAQSQLTPWRSLLSTFLGIFACGAIAGLLALTPMLRSRLLPALRAE